MTATERLHERGQSIWLDKITRAMLDSGQLRAYIDDYSVTGLTSNPSIFDKAIAGGGYDDAIREKGARGTRPEALFFELAIEDLRRAADAFLPIHERTAGLDGWVSLEVSPLLAHDPDATVEVAKELYNRAARQNLLIKIPGTKEGLLAVEEAIEAGVPVNVTLLFSADHYAAAADAYMRGVERRIEAQQDPVVGSVASIGRACGQAPIGRGEELHRLLERPHRPHRRAERGAARLNPKLEVSDGHDPRLDRSAHDAPGLGGPAGALRGHSQPAPARHVRRGPDAGRAARR